MSFTNDGAEYMTDIGTFISMCGQMYAQEEANTCEYCEENGMRETCEEQRDNLSSLCYICMEKCDDDEFQRYYEEMVEDYAEGKSSCVQPYDGSELYIGYTCGADGKSVELAGFQDDECTVMSEEQDGYNMASMMYSNENNEEARMVGEMQMMSQMYSMEFSCDMGGDDYDFCEDLLAESISKDDCDADGNYQYQNQGEEEGEGEDMNEYAADAYEAEGNTGVMIYSDDIQEACGTIVAIEEALVEKTYVNPYTGTPFSVMMASENSLSGGAIFGITALVAATVAAAGFAFGKFTRSKSELEEPVFQGGALH
eukprot:scaffold996_cov107-Skeletonema_marinoi.AAC.1